MAAFGASSANRDYISNCIEGYCNVYDAAHKTYRKKMAVYDSQNSGIQFYEVDASSPTGRGKATGRPQAIINVVSILDSEKAGDVGSSRKNRLELQCHSGASAVGSLALSALGKGPLGGKKGGGLWGKIKDTAHEINHHDSVFVAFDTAEDKQTWFGAFKLSLPLCHDTMSIYASSMIESSLSWISSNLGKIRDESKTKVGSIGSSGRSEAKGVKIVQPENPNKVGDDMSDLILRYDSCHASFNAVISHVAQQGGQATTGFMHYRPTDAEMEEDNYKKHDGIPLHHNDLVKASIICQKSGDMSRCYNALVKGNANSIKWVVRETINEFGNDECNSKYKAVRLLVEVWPSELPVSMIMHVSLHFKAMLMAIRPSTNAPDSPLSVYAHALFAGVQQDARELQFRAHCYDMAVVNVRLEKLEIRDNYVKEIENVHALEVKYRLATLRKESDQSLCHASLSLSLCTILKRHYNALDNVTMMAEKVLPLMESAELIRQEVLGHSHPLTLTSTNSFAILLRKLGKYDEAVEAYMRALNALEQSCGPDDAKTTACCHNIGMVLQLKGDSRGAIKYLRRDVDALFRKLGPTHADTIKSTSHLIKIMDSIKGDEFQVQMMELKAKQLEAEFAIHGAGSIEYLDAVHSLAETLLHEGKFDEASRQLKGAIQLYEKSHTSDHAEVVTALLVCKNNLGMSLNYQGDKNGAEKAYKDCVKGYLACPKHGEGHISTALARNNLAMMILDSENVPEHKKTEALGFLELAIAGLEEEQRKMSDVRVLSKNAQQKSKKNYGKRLSKGISSLMSFGEGQEAEETLKQDEGEMKEVLGVIAGNLASHSDEADGGGMEHLRASIRKNEKKFGKSSSDTLLDCHNLAVTLVEAMKRSQDDRLRASYLKEAMDLAKRISEGIEKQGELSHFSKNDGENWGRWLARKEGKK